MNKFFGLLMCFVFLAVGCQKSFEVLPVAQIKQDLNDDLQNGRTVSELVSEEENGDKSGKGVQKPPLQTEQSRSSAQSLAVHDDLSIENFSSPAKSRSQRISLDLQQAEVAHVLRLLAEIGGRNLVLGDTVQGKVSLHVRDVEWSEVLAIVLRQKSLVKIEQGNILRILPANELEKERERILLNRKKDMEELARAADLTPLQTLYVPIRYAQAEELAKRLAPLLSKRGKITPDPRSNLLILCDSEAGVQNIKTALTYLDKPQRQVMIEARLVYATEIFQRNLGMKWGGKIVGDRSKYLSLLDKRFSGEIMLSGLNLFPNSSGFSLAGNVTKLGGDMLTLDMELQLGEQAHIAKIVSAPRIATLNNHQAKISQGIMIKVTTETGEGKAPSVEYKPAILLLEVRPQITPDNKLILDLHIQDDSKAAGEDIDTRSANTRLLVDDGQTIVLGGIQKVEDLEMEYAVPGLSKIPLLGWFFKNTKKERKKAELLVFIRPKILDE